MGSEGNRIFSLHDSSGMWLVDEGVVDLFLIRLREGSPAGARDHVLRAGAGEAIFGLAVPAGSDFGLFAAVGPEAILRTVSPEEPGADSTLSLAAKWRESLARVVPGITSQAEGFDAALLSALIEKHDNAEQASLLRFQARIQADIALTAGALKELATLQPGAQVTRDRSETQSLSRACEFWGNTPALPSPSRKSCWRAKRRTPSGQSRELHAFGTAA